MQQRPSKGSETLNSEPCCRPGLCAPADSGELRPPRAAAAAPRRPGHRAGHAAGLCPGAPLPLLSDFQEVTGLRAPGAGGAPGLSLFPPSVRASGLKGHGITILLHHETLCWTCSRPLPGCAPPWPQASGLRGAKGSQWQRLSGSFSGVQCTWAAAAAAVLAAQSLPELASPAGLTLS